MEDGVRGGFADRERDLDDGVPPRVALARDVGAALRIAATWDACAGYEASSAVSRFWIEM